MKDRLTSLLTHEIRGAPKFAKIRVQILGTPYLTPTKTFCGQAADVCVGQKKIKSKMIKNFLLILFLLFSSHAEAASEEAIFIKKSNARFEYYAKGEKIKEPLRYFSDLAQNEGKDASVGVYFSDGVPMDIVMNIRGIICKAGIKTSRYYYFNKETRKAIEFIFKGPLIPVPEN